jgi:hypothetical protein
VPAAAGGDGGDDSAKGRAHVGEEVRERRRNEKELQRAQEREATMGLYNRARRQDLWRRAWCHVGATASGLCQRSRYLGAIAYSAELCYLDAIGYGAEQRVQK